ncbi:MAG: hypothetical protein COW12_01345 [Candidatus Omnitrophica bacterium CG12_big_fil_rev_8_21_14_0_65_45_16]|nr:MAG: hypothetical protein COW12_01345 [Candidatus Omnitrophica bacterium CG12_big_fil_rev_8_21_14_0_65_45_16]
MNIHMAVHGVTAVGRFTGRCWYWVTFVWVLLRAVFFWWLFLVLIWDFTDLLGIPLVQDLKAGIHKVASYPEKIFTKEDPAARQARIEQEERKKIKAWAQAHCRHIHKRNGLWNYFCPLCGKKLIEIGDPPLWQI